jgi:hypothetical protein
MTQQAQKSPTQETSTSKSNKDTDSHAQSRGRPTQSGRKRIIYDYLCLIGGLYGTIIGLAQLGFLATAYTPGYSTEERLLAMRAVDVAGWGQAFIFFVISIFAMLEFDLAQPLEDYFKQDRFRELRIKGFLKSPEDIRLILAGMAFLTSLILGFGANNWFLYFFIPTVCFGISFVADVTGNLNPMLKLRFLLKKGENKSEKPSNNGQIASKPPK